LLSKSPAEGSSLSKGEKRFMDLVRIHALEGKMLSSLKGLQKLRKIVSSSSEPSQVFVLSPIREGMLSFSSLLSSAKAKDERLWPLLDKSEISWGDYVDSLSLSDSDSVTSAISKSFEDMEDILKSVWLLEDVSESTVEYFDSMTSYFLSLAAVSFFRMNGRPAGLLSVGKGIKEANFPTGVTFLYGKLPLPDHGNGKGEGESEYAASLTAASCHGNLTFWNSRSLLCSARQRDIPSAKVIERLTFAEATELSFFGAPIVHPHNLIPAASEGIPVSLRYWGEPEEPGTLITDRSTPKDRRFPVKAFSVMRGVSIINIEGAGMSGIPGISSRLFTALRRKGISVILISQASSEYSICFAVPSNEVAVASETTRDEFADELRARKIISISAVKGMAILACVGEVMSGQIGVSGKFFSALAQAGVNISAIAQGSSERNISAVIQEKDSLRALTAVHAAFFLSAQTLSVGLLGPGNIGGTLLDQISREKDRLKKQFDIDIRVRGIATSKKMFLSEEGIDLEHWRESFSLYSEPMDMDKFLRHVGAEYYPHAAIVDCTTSQEIAFSYGKLLERFHVITPNKKAGSAPYNIYKSIFEASRKSGKRFLYETTVGAGLPIINTLNDLIQTGDEVLKIEGMGSGTLAWLFSRYDGTVPFSELVKEARDLGYTEPDPRDDLSGMDVARKTVILAREIGLDTELSSLTIESLVPEKLRNTSKEEFLLRLGEMDGMMKRKYDEAAKNGRVLRYVGKVDGGRCSVALETYPKGHPFAEAQGTDNVIAFTTARYNERQPLVVKGPGAGPEVTAGGVFADILRLSAHLGAKIL